MSHRVAAFYQFAALPDFRGLRQPLRAFCRCSQERIETVLKSFDATDRDGMIEPDGKIHVTCEYCSRVYDVTPAAVDG